MSDPYAIIDTMQLTEKGTRMTEADNQYLFRVSRDANKAQIKKAIETLFKVKVSRVNTMNYIGKLKRERSQRYGRRAAWKRAVVTLAPNHTIDLT